MGNDYFIYMMWVGMCSICMCTCLYIYTVQCAGFIFIYNLYLDIYINISGKVQYALKLLQKGLG